MRRLTNRKNPVPVAPGAETSNTPTKEKAAAKGYVHYTETELDSDEAVAAKLKMLRGSIFGMPIVKFRIGGIRRVWVPYAFLSYEFYVDRKALGGRLNLDKSGTAGVVLDLNEFHPFSFDNALSDDIPMKKKAENLLELKGVCIKNIHSGKKIRAAAEEFLQYKVIRKIYGRECTLSCKNYIEFYRPAMEIEVYYKSGVLNRRYAYLDMFDVNNEHITSLRYNING